MRKHISKSKDIKYDAEWWTGHILRLGVWASATFMIGGFITAALWPSSVVTFLANPSLGDLALRIFSGNIDPAILMFAGLVLLMFTPILRIIAALFGFAIEKDWRFVLVSSIVFLMLVGEIIYSISIK
jgi:uncharacterized membrane protein